MQSSQPPRCRSIAVLSLAACVTAAVGGAASCADDSAQVALPLPAPSRRPARPATPSATPDAAPSVLPTIDVGGRVVDQNEGPVVGRPVVVVDRRGKRQEIMTDEGGGFYAMKVAPPYDLLIEEAPSGAVITPLVYLGLRRADPWFEVFEGQSEGQGEGHPASQPLRLGVKLPPCRAAGGPCWVSVVSASASGSGGTAGSYVTGTESALFELDHAWREANVRSGEAIDVHVLTGDAQYTEYAYARVSHVAARPGEPTDLGVTEPMLVGSTEPVTVAGRAVGLPAGWQWTLASQLDLAGGGSFALRYDWNPVATMRLPKLAGATFRVDAWAQHPPTPDRPYLHRSSHAWTGPLPLTVNNVSLDVPTPPATVRPALEGQLSSAGKGFSWTEGARGLVSLVVVDLARGRQRFRAFTAQSEIPLQRIEALGLERLERGEHVLDLTTTPGATLDGLTQPHDEPGRRPIAEAPGAMTYQHFRFVVTQ